MDIIKTKLAEILKKAEIEASEKEEQIIALLIKYKYGLYAAEITRMTRFHDGMVRGHLCKLKKNGLLESKEAEMLDSKEILQGYRLYIPDGYRIMSLKGEEVFLKKGAKLESQKCIRSSIKKDLESRFNPDPEAKDQQYTKLKKSIWMNCRNNSGIFLWGSSPN